MEKNKKKKKVIMEGEATGHAHVAEETDAYVEDTADGGRVLHAPHGTTIGHEEHNTIEVPPGDWDVTRVQEFDHPAESARDVLD